jgi:hypothetical protein
MLTSPGQGRLSRRPDAHASAACPQAHAVLRRDAVR